ncbi:MAG: putative DNA ligase [candidate division WS6 bacterium GW2011_GWF1_36_8]|uniref:DNA ligase (ATP) n=1 Tax=candidate division WS6 bacterium GW2011_GWF1_36_8 TaxID=1619098 RepID=A0A0G0FB54_9BACT|nr:MAG: putative DNA ligase [candidate division WS6 bacterium GW2011_GWF1_36_8]
MERVTFKKVCEVFQQLEVTDSRNDMTGILSEFLKSLDSKDAQIVAYLVQGRLAPFFVVSEFNFSEKSLTSLFDALCKLKGRKFDMQKKRTELGDIGDAAEFLSNELGFKSEDIALEEIYNRLWEIMNASGTGSVEKKKALVMGLLQIMNPLEAKYLSRIICGELRMGLNSKTVLDAFSFVLNGDKSLRERLNRSYGVSADLGYICSLIMKVRDGADEKILDLHITPGVPVLSRLVERVGSFEEVIERFGDEFLIQPKFDGLRCQIHKFKKNDSRYEERMVWEIFTEKPSQSGLFESKTKEYEVRLFTRNLEDVTDMFPEIVDAAMEFKQESFVLDSEVLGWNYKENTFLSYQETMQRRRKYGVEGMQADIPVKAQTFDLLYLNGEDISEVDTNMRIEKLEREFSDTHWGIGVCKTTLVKGIEDLQQIFDENVGKKLEGIIVKQLKGPYYPGARNFEWIKLKKSMQKDLVDTIDLVAVGFYNGSGKRSKLGMGAVLGALYNPELDIYEAICKVGTGFSDEQLKTALEGFQEDIVNKKPKNVEVNDVLAPDVWVDPKIVFSVEADEITQNIRADLNIGGGLSLRFPRLVEWSRDKTSEEATTIEELKHLYIVQKGKK